MIAVTIIIVRSYAEMSGTRHCILRTILITPNHQHGIIKIIMNTSPVHHEYIVNMLTTHHQCIVNVSSLHHHCIVDTSTLRQCFIRLKESDLGQSGFCEFASVYNATVEFSVCMYVCMYVCILVLYTCLCMELEGICLNPWVGCRALVPKCDIPDFYREKTCMLANFLFVPACMLEPFSCIFIERKRVC